MAAGVNLFERLSEAKTQVLRPDSPVPEVARLMVSTMKPEVLDLLANPPRRRAGIGKGGNTNYSEGVLKKAFASLKVSNTQFQPNGTQRFPDLILGSDWVEWKSVRDGGNFAFNDGLPRGWAFYYFVSRKRRQVLAMRGDIVLFACDSEVVEEVVESIKRAREIGMTSKKSGSLCYFYPRQNLYIRNFLSAAPANGWYDFDQNIIWTPEEA